LQPLGAALRGDDDFIERIAGACGVHHFNGKKTPINSTK